MKEEQLSVKDIQSQHASRLKKLEKAPLEQQQSLFDIPNRNQFFTGRTDILNSINTQLKSSTKTITISGLGGVGKTSIALEMCWRMKESFPGGVYWLTADTRGGDNALIHFLSVQLAHF